MTEILRNPTAQQLATPRVQNDEALSRTVDEIIERVKSEGDKALYDYAEKFDHVRLDHLVVTEAEFDEAFAALEPEMQKTLLGAHANVEAFHARQKRDGFVFARENGALLGQRVLPLARVGVYVPGGTAAYPSTVLMNVVPARVAGVSEIIMTTPPGRDGRVPAAILCAAKLAGATKVVKCGGAQAVAALAFGTESVPAVDKITGPGNAYVAAAKRRVYGQVDIDMIAGPSEILVVADDSANADWVAADLLSQAEHDMRAAAILVTTSETLAKDVLCALSRRLDELPRADIARASVEANGRIAVVDSLDAALGLSNEIAPEHLELCVREPFSLLGRVKNAGSVFLGHHTPEAVGDYWAGANHTLPTSGTARFSSPLSVDDFTKKQQFISYTREALREAEADIVRFAEREGLSAHARSVSARFGGDEA